MLVEATDDAWGTTTRNASDSVLQHLYAPRGEVQHALQVQENIESILALRAELVQELAMRNSQTDHDNLRTSCRTTTFEEWTQWLNENELSRDNMTYAVQKWMNRFEAIDISPSIPKYA